MFFQGCWSTQQLIVHDVLLVAVSFLKRTVKGVWWGSVGMGEGGNIGASIIKIGFGVYYTILIIRSPPQNPILSFKAPTLRGLGLSGRRLQQEQAACERARCEQSQLGTSELGCRVTCALECSKCSAICWVLANSQLMRPEDSGINSWF